MWIILIALENANAQERSKLFQNVMGPVGLAFNGCLVQH